jgi:hypothetical protein
VDPDPDPDPQHCWKLESQNDQLQKMRLERWKRLIVHRTHS